jgi:hypothetical protein
MREMDAAIQDVGSDPAGAGLVGVYPIQLEFTLIDPVETPRRIFLRGADTGQIDVAVLLNREYTRIPSQFFNLFGSKLRCKTF